MLFEKRVGELFYESIKAAFDFDIAKNWDVSMAIGFDELFRKPDDNDTEKQPEAFHLLSEDTTK